ncbi:hypothetical protein LguiA_001514 [Lonicera macranthoides]
MATLSHSDSGRLYSWWWDSHISPKNSKWLQENLTDMDDKVKAMIKLIEEDADSFARRAEMYYKKRPELMKLVEEFYRAYRALAERYDHATGELRQAHRTMSEVFPNLVLPEDSPSSSTNGTTPPRTPEMPHPLRALLDIDDLHKDAMGLSGESSGGRISKKGLKQLHEICGAGEVVVRNSRVDEEKMKKAHENEVQKLKKDIDDMQAEKEALLLQYQQSVEKLYSVEGQLNDAQKGFSELNVQAGKAENEVLTLKEALIKLEAERVAGFVQYKQCMEKISDLERVILVTEEDARLLKERADRAESEVERLKEVVAKLKEERESASHQYELCMEKISKLENNLLAAQEEVNRLNSELLKGVMKLKSAEEKSVVLETSNQNLRLEAENLIKKIAAKDQELCEKHKELEKIQGCVQDERLKYVQIEATLQTLQKLNSQSQEDQRALRMELKNGLGMLKELEEENRRVKDENWSLNEANSSSAVSMGNMGNEILGLRKMKERLEEEVAQQLGQSDYLQQEIYRLKEEIECLNRSYKALMEQVELVGLNPVSFGSSVKDLQDENSILRQAREKDRDEKEALFKKLDSMEELVKNNASLHSSLSNVSSELNGSKEKVKALQESCEFLRGDKSALVNEKVALLSQLQLITENMQNLLERNTFLENSLSHANAELESLRAKSNSLDELCQLLTNEKSNLVNERSSLVVQLENVEQRLRSLEKKFLEFEGKYAGLEKERESTDSQVKELRISLGVEKQERESFSLWSENRFSSLENHINLLQEEGNWRKKEFQEELDKAVIAQFELFILKKFIQDMEEKNYSLLFELHKHIEASKLTDQLISELESENLEQQVEAELLLVEIEKLRLGIYKVFKALEVGPETGSEDKFENEQISVHQIVGDIENMKFSLSNYKDEVDNLYVKQGDLQRDYAELQKEYSWALEENKSLVRKFSNLKEEKCTLEEENNSLVLETLAFDNLSTILKSFEAEHAAELQRFSEELCNLHAFNDELEEEVFTLRGKLEMNETENLLLKSSVDRLEIELWGAQDFNFDLKEKLSKEKDFVRQREKELLEAELKLEATEKMNSELCRTVEELKGEYEESNIIREKEIQFLHEENGKLESELGILHGEIEERKVREENLNSELKETNNEFELWEAEASSFHFDLQISAVREVLFEDKVRELSGVCESLEDESALRTKEIEQMKETVLFKESEIRGLNNQINAYAPIIVSLKDNVASLERNTLSLVKLTAENGKPKAVELSSHPDQESSQELKEDQNSPSLNGISELQSLQTSIKAVEKVVLEEIKRRGNSKPEGEMTEIQVMKSKCSPDQEKGKQKQEIRLWYELDDDALNLQKSKPEVSKNGALMKDIPLDHVSNGSLKRGNSGLDDEMLELWETVNESQRKVFEPTEEEDIENPSPQVEKELSVDRLLVPSSSTVLNQGANKGKILQRLASDAQKLASIQTTVNELRRKLETTNKKSKKARGFDFETVKEQLQETEETMVRLFDLIGHLTKRVEEKGSGELEEGENVQKRRVLDQARKGSEKIGRLQLEVEKIHYLLMKMDGEKKSKGKSRFSRTKSRTSIILREFIYSGRSSSGRKKKARSCGCFRPPSNSGEGNQF